MNITCDCAEMHTSVGQHNTIRLELEDVTLAGTVDTREVLNQLDSAVIIEWLVEHGYTVLHQERAA